MENCRNAYSCTYVVLGLVEIKDQDSGFKRLSEIKLNQQIIIKLEDVFMLKMS